MALSKGWNGTIVFSGTILKEYVGVTNDSGGDSYYLNQYPVVDTNNSVTDDPANISVTLNESYVNASVDVYIANTSMNLSGSTGFLSFSANCSHDKAVALEVTYDYREPVGYATGINFAFDSGLEAAFCIGARTAAEIVEGNKGITGTITEFFADRRAFQRAYGGDINEGMQSITIEVDEPTANLSFKLTGVKVGGWSMDHAHDAIVAQSCNFTAANISLYS